MDSRIVSVIALVYIISLSTSFILQSQSNENGFISIQLYPANHPTNFSIVGTYQYYGQATLYSQNVSIIASTDLWNIKYAKGDVNMTFYNNYLSTKINLYNLMETTPEFVVAGYPNLLYGEESWWNLGPTEESPYLSLPMKISDLPDFYSIVNYTLYNVNGTIDDFSYDIWITRNTPYPSSLGSQDIELMIWTYWSGSLAGVFPYAGTLNIPTIVNGTVYNYSFQVYVRPSSSSTSWVTVFVLSPVKLQGEVGIPIGYVLKNLGLFTSLAGLNFNASQYYLDAIQLGMEFHANSNGYANLGYNIYYWKILVPLTSISHTFTTIGPNTATITSKTTTTNTTTIAVSKTTTSTGMQETILYGVIVVLIVIIVILAVLLIRR